MAEVSATGRYDESQQVLVRNRTYNGIPGYFVLTPLQVPGGNVVIVNRGFVPLETSGTKPKVPPAPSGVVAVNGRVRSTQKRGLFGPRDPVEGTLTEVARADLVARCSSRCRTTCSPSTSSSRRPSLLRPAASRRCRCPSSTTVPT